ncbi:MAG: amidophosphoribosyltransferase, partial [Candidatus Adiutrix sp.]|nr:amidophosphoribosyltransferase [Candidatus Adiutrix sp.]
MTCDCKKLPASAEGPRWREECGVVGVWAPGEAVMSLAYLALFALQHRGQESAGLAVTDGLHIDVEKGLGLMREAFRDRMPSLNGHSAVGHVRYSTASDNLYCDIQPVFASFHGGFICLGLNGRLTNAPELREKLGQSGCVLQTTADGETLLNLAARSEAKGIEEKILSSLAQVDGAYSLTIMTGDRLIGARDP